MSMKLTAMAMDVRVGNPLRKLVLLKLCDNANDRGECFPSVQYIADQCEISRRSVVNHINSLIEMGFLQRRSRYQKAEQISNFYVIDLSGKQRILRTQVDKETGTDTDGNGVQEMHTPRAGDALPRAGDALPPRAGDAHGTSHSFEPVIEPVIHQGIYQDSLREVSDETGGDLFASGDENQFEQPLEMPPGKKSAKPGYPDWFENLWQKFPPRTGASDKRKALHCANARLAQGKTQDDLLEAVDRYARFVRATGKWGSQYVMQAQTFFGPGGHIENPWSFSNDFNPQPPRPPKESAVDRAFRHAAEICADAEAIEIHQRAVGPDDSDVRPAMDGESRRRQSG